MDDKTLITLVEKFGSSQLAELELNDGSLHLVLRKEGAIRSAGNAAGAADAASSDNAAGTTGAAGNAGCLYRAWDLKLRTCSGPRGSSGFTSKCGQPRRYRRNHHEPYRGNLLPVLIPRCTTLCRSGH